VHAVSILPNDDRFTLWSIMCWLCKGEGCANCEGRGRLEMKYEIPKKNSAQKFKDTGE
jgi:hypothetical protein